MGLNVQKDPHWKNIMNLEISKSCAPRWLHMAYLSKALCTLLANEDAAGRCTSAFRWSESEVIMIVARGLPEHLGKQEPKRDPFFGCFAHRPLLQWPSASIGTQNESN